MKRFLESIDNISETTGRISSWIIPVLAILVVIEVILRRFFGSPTIWNFEVTKQLYAFHFMIVAPFTLLHGAHISIDIIYEKFSIKKRDILDIVSYIVFFFPFWTVVFIEGLKYSKASWAIHETGMGIFAIPLYPIKTIIPLTALLMIIQGLALFLRKVYSLIRK